LKKYQYFLTLFVVSALLLCSSLSFADDSDKNVSEEEVVVTATRTAVPESKAPGKTEVITKEQIEASGATTVAEALADAGVSVSSNGGKAGAANIQLDGSNSNQTLVLINGLPLSAGPDGKSELSFIPTVGIDRIEISHGPLSSLYGSSGLGGVVNIITDLTGESKDRVNVSGGSFNTKSLDLLTQRNNWGLAIGGLMTDGYRTHSETFSNYFMGQYNLFQDTDEYLKLYFQAFNKHGEQPGSLSFLSTTATQADQDMAINLNGLYNFWGGVWEYKIYRQQYDLKYSDPAWNTNSHHQVFSYGIDTAGQYQLKDHELVTGVMIKQDSCESTDFGDHSRSNNALFLQDSWQLADSLKIITGLREDCYSDFSSPLLPKITLVKSITDQITIKAGYGKTFRAPTFEDLYWYDTINYQFGDSNLKPETGNRTDLIAEWKENEQSVTLNFYQANLRDEIDWLYNDTTWATTATNIDKVYINGINFNWKNTWAKIITTRVNYDYIDKKATDSVLGDEQDYNKYGKHQLTLGLDFNNKAWNYGINWRYIRDRDYVSYGKTYNLPDYNILNLDIRYQMYKNLSFSLAVDNSVDKYYQIENGYPMPGRSYTLSTKYTF
jgi:outer membrane cobalamin receptor